MSLDALLKLTAKQFEKVNPDLEFKKAADEKPPTGFPVNKPLLEYILDRRFMPYGRYYLIYGKKGSSKTSLFYEFVKMVQATGGDAIWLETENAADLDYAKAQGVDLNRLIIQHPKTLEEALTLSEMYIRNMPEAYPDGDTPVLIALDSIASTMVEDEMEAQIGSVPIGKHARLLSQFFRKTVHLLANEKCIFLLLNQLKEKIGTFGFSEDKDDTLLGGNAQFFHSTYQWKMKKIRELVDIDELSGASRKIGSRHVIECKRNKLGREGKTQEIEFDLFINGGIDWWTPLVRMLAEEYGTLVKKSGGYVKWVVPGMQYTADDGTTAEINPEQNYRDYELARIIMRSPQACDEIRRVFKIPEAPGQEVVREVETEKKEKRKRKKDEKSPLRNAAI